MLSISGDRFNSDGTLLPLDLLRAIESDALSPRTRRRLELFLGVPIWSSAIEFQRANTIARIIGTDPILTTKTKLKKMAADLGIPTNPQIGQAELVLRIIEAVCRNITSQSQPRPNKVP